MLLAKPDQNDELADAGYWEPLARPRLLRNHDRFEARRVAWRGARCGRDPSGQLDLLTSDSFRPRMRRPALACGHA